MKMALNQMPQGTAALLAPAISVVTGAILLVCLAILVRAAMLWITPAGLPVTDQTEIRVQQPAAARITKFASLPMDPFHRDAIVQDMAVSAPETSLDLKLVGVRTGNPGSAILQMSDGRQQVFQPGDKILNGVDLVSIAPEYVILGRRGARERLGFPKSGQTSLLAGTDTTANAGGYVLPASEWARLAGAVTFTRQVRDGKVIGMEIQPKNSSFDLSRIGLAPGDILVRIGQEDLRQGRPEFGLIFNQLSQQSTFTIEFLRNGQQRAVKVGSS